jgi:tetraacyldisaccharide-1-P 4'-kinase
MNSEAPLDELPENYKVVAIKLHHTNGKPDVEIYIKEGDRVLYGEKVLPRGILTENFLNITGASLL